MSGGSTQQFRPALIAHEALTGMRFVKLTTTSKEVDMADTAGERVIGVADFDYAIRDHVSVCAVGEVEMTSSEAITTNDKVSTSANGRARVAVAGDYVAGVALTSCGGADEVVRVFLLPSTSTSSTALDTTYAESSNSGLHVAQVTYDFAVDGGVIGPILLGATIPDNAIVWDGFYEVLTTVTTAGADAGTLALHVNSANDLVTATAVSAGGNIWDAGIHPIVPVGTAALAIKLTAARALTLTIGGQAVTAGKFVLYVFYVLGL